MSKPEFKTKMRTLKQIQPVALTARPKLKKNPFSNSINSEANDHNNRLGILQTLSLVSK